MLSTRLNLTRNARRTQVQSAKRALFKQNGSDPQENLNTVQKELEELIQVASKKWDFDFINGRPMVTSSSSRYLWETVQTDHQQQQPNTQTPLITGDTSTATTTTTTVTSSTTTCITTSTDTPARSSSTTQHHPDHVSSLTTRCSCRSPEGEEEPAGEKEEEEAS